MTDVNDVTAAPGARDVTLLVLNAEPPPRLGSLTGRTRILHGDESTIARQLPEADVLLVWDFLSDAVRHAWPGPGARPRWVHTASAGVDHLMCPELTASDTVVTNARGIFETPIAEYVAGLVLAAAKHFSGTNELQRQRRWQHRETRRVAGTRAVVVGSGPIGRAVAATLKGLGVKVALTGRTARAGVHGPEDLMPLLAGADWVVAAAPLTDATRGMFDARAFGAMSPNSYFINVGRGQLVVEEDLLSALHKRWIGGAALDVFEQEPLQPESPLWDVPGLVVSPHMSGDVVGWRDELTTQFLELFDLWAAGKPLPNVVDKNVGYVPLHD
ncbi:2-hydroxyacid dehydrogenase [Streptomyces spiroverticillatus]|uniref:2-hydroxyacid dehydrogenase n=1 Tax=Streptomyces finlayi TaxID=67296 RepID=A0A919CAC9_9ACTN|nr:D-2-hydroxyacid dehydrogenase [Streptomyces finlayi]GHA10730.1 2-hydroxyacid dehydrogenase [Streptomyces spiroverticillatus]GHC95430.1 2-hydroxyacid dehydrogenase [Streptomyces finlayi]